VVTEVLKQTAWATDPVSASHFRTSDGAEVDLVLEAQDGRVCGIEVKAAGGLPSWATRGLEYLRDRLGDRFVAGLVLNLGTQSQRIGDRLAVAPVDALWRQVYRPRTKERKDSAGTVSTGPGFFESRATIQPATTASSTQVPLLPLKLIFFHRRAGMGASELPRAGQ